MICVDIHTDPPVFWDRKLFESPASTMHQTVSYAVFEEKILRSVPYYIVARNGDQLLGLLLVFKGCYFDQALPVVVNKVVERLFSTLYWYDGPVLLTEDAGGEISGAIFNKINELARMAGATRCRASRSLLYNESQAIHRGFIRAGYETTTYATFLIDLNTKTETLWQNLKRSVRKNIKNLSSTRNLYVKQLETKIDFRQFYDIWCQLRIRTQTPIFMEFHAFYEWAVRNRDRAPFFIVMEGGKPLAGQGVFTFNRGMVEVLIAQSDDAFNEKIYASDFLKWEIIKWGHNMGFRYYDLAGVSPNAVTPKETGIRRYKAKWGGTYTEYPVYSKVFRKEFVSLYEFGKRLIRNIGKG